MGILYLVFFGTVLRFFWYYQGIQAIGLSRVSVFINLVPVSAAQKILTAFAKVYKNQ
jgi:drug/metabolite transporter (DMT)-like permease